MAIPTATTPQELDAVVQGRTNPVVAYFWASWAPMCTQTDVLTKALASDCKNVIFVSVEAEEAEDLASKYDVESVPAYVFIKGGVKVGIVVGANVPDITKQVQALNADFSSKHDVKSADAAHTQSANPIIPKNVTVVGADDLNQRLKALVNQAPVMLFMKGEPGAEKCGFSRKVVEVLQANGVQFGHFNILEDETVRAGLKEYSKWPTYPQVYAKGSLIGGIDIIKELADNGELKEELGLNEAPLEDRLKKLVNKAPVMVFMKGQPGAERCGFSRQLTALLQEHKIEFDSFDILGDEEVRQGLKEFSKWPTYPQVYNKGSLVGGLDILKELAESGELASELS